MYCNTVQLDYEYHQRLQSNQNPKSVVYGVCYHLVLHQLSTCLASIIILSYAGHITGGFEGECQVVGSDSPGSVPARVHHVY